MTRPWTKAESLRYAAARSAYDKAWSVALPKAQAALKKATDTLLDNPREAASVNAYEAARAAHRDVEEQIATLLVARDEVAKDINRAIELDSYKGRSTLFEKVIFYDGTKMFVPASEIPGLRSRGMLLP